MSRRNDPAKMNIQAVSESQPKSSNNPEMNRKAAEADIPKGPAKGQDKRAGGFSRDN
jgi:hypothetical protein